MIEYKVKEVAERRGVKSSYELQKLCDLHPPQAVRLWRNDITCLKKPILDILCKKLKCQPGDLIKFVPD